MAGKLATLIRLHRWRLDEQQRVLAENLQVLDKHEAALRAIDAWIEEEQAYVRDAPAEHALTYSAFASAVDQRRTTCLKAIETAQGEVAHQRDAVQACYRELRTIELADEARGQREAAERAREERATLDEMAVLGHARRPASGSCR
ncbi:MAG: flagellar FliJ family protein [Rhodospirillales bacterium]|nr:flagellar FliJ family protein [Rhodospirillales bacterium]